jgi:tetratricopeptide (TPR) repeat protein
MKKRYFKNLMPTIMIAVFVVIGFSSIIFAINDKKMDDYFCKDIKKPFFKVENKTEEGVIVVPGRSQGRDFKFLMPKPAGKKRIFIVGESVAGLMYWPDNNFVSEFVEKPEVINCGMGAYDSARIFDVFMEAMNYQPDMIIVLSGNNEVGLEPCGDFGAKIRRRISTFRINIKRLFYGSNMKEAEHFVSLKVHEKRLRKMVKLAKKKNIPVTLCTLPANMSDFPPSGYLPFKIKNFAKAFFLMEGGNIKKAEKIFKNILIENPKEPVTHFYLAQILEKSNKFIEAKKYYELAIEWDTKGDRISQERNEMIRKVAKEEGACLADLKKSFMARADKEIINGEYIVDGVHWFSKYNYFVVSQTLKYIGKCDKAGVLFKKDKISKLQKIKTNNFKIVKNDSKKEALEIFHYAIAFISGDLRPGEINERSLAMLNRVYEKNKGFIEEVSNSKSALTKHIRKNFWTKNINEPISVNSWYPDFLHHVAELFRRKGKLDKAKDIIERVLALAPEHQRVLLTKRLIIKGMKKGVSAEDLTEEVLNYNRKILQEENHKLQIEKHKLHFEKRIFKSEKKKLKDKRKREEKYVNLADVPYVKESKRIADRAIKKYMAGNIKGAKLDFKKAIKINFGNIEAQVTMCSINLLQKDFNEGLKYCDAAIDMAEFPLKHTVVLPEILADVLVMRAEIYSNMKRYEEALVDLKRAVEKAPADWKDFKKVKAMSVSYQRLCLPDDQEKNKKY